MAGHLSSKIVVYVLQMVMDSRKDTLKRKGYRGGKRVRKVVMLLLSFPYNESDFVGRTIK